MSCLVYKGEGRPYDEWASLLKDYDGKEPLVIYNNSSRTQDQVTQSLKRYMSNHFSEFHVSSRKGVLYVNKPLKECKRVPGWLYYEGDWWKMFKSARLRESQKVVNLTSDNQRCCDFVKQLNRFIIDNDIENYEARGVRGSCILATCDYFENNDWRSDW